MDSLPDYSSRNIIWAKFTINDARSMFTPKNVNIRDKNGLTALRWFLTLGPDDVEILRYFVGIGASLEPEDEESFLHCVSSFRDKHRLANELINMGISPNIKHGGTDSNHTPLFCAIFNDKRKTIKLLLDRGAKFDEVLKHALKLKISPWLEEFLKNRENIRSNSLVILGLKTANSTVLGDNGKDVLQIIARCVWGMRGDVTSDDTISHPI